MKFKLNSERLRKLRRERDWTQEYVAELLDMSQGDYSRWETGRIEPSLSNIMRIAALFGVSVESLIIEGGEDKCQESQSSGR